MSLDQFDDYENFIGSYDYKYNGVENIIEKLCKKRKYLQAIILKLISIHSCSNEKTNEFDFDTLINLIEELDENYYRKFAEDYEINFDVLFDFIHKILYKCEVSDLWGFGPCYVKKPYDEIFESVKSEFEQLKNNDELRSALC